MGERNLMLSKKVLVSLPPEMLIQIDMIAETEYRTRSDLIREALRRYLDAFRKDHPDGFDTQGVTQFK